MPGSASPSSDLRSALEDLFPRAVSIGLVQGPLSVGALFPEEARTVSEAGEKRRRDFERGRHCAREALAGLGLPPGPIPVGPDRAPVWPEGVVGSITHCEGIAAAVVGWRADVTSLGLDVEPAAPLAKEVVGDICTEAERAAMSGLPPAGEGVDWPLIAFCAKEAIYKAVAPAPEGWLGFQDVEVRFEPDECRFAARLVGRPRSEVPDLGRLEGRYAVAGGFVLAGVTLTGTS